MREYIFDDKNSVLHALLGYFTPVSMLIDSRLCMVMILLSVVYLLYEIREPERPWATVGDIVEYLWGGFTGLVVVMLYVLVKII